MKKHTQTTHHRPERLRTTPLVPYASPEANRFAKTRLQFGNPVSQAKNNPYFVPLPAPQKSNFNLPMSAILPAEADAAQKAGALVFHSVGDTGGVYGDDVQAALAGVMEGQIKDAQTNKQNAPGFLYILGDVVYFNGLSTMYGNEFYEPYKFYPAAIIAIPGNHDGDTRVQKGDPADNEPSLYGFTKNFCDSSPHDVYAYRPTMTQPYIYWTLECPFVTIVGLYANVEGSLDARGSYEQQGWFEQQMKQAPQDKALIVAVHHPPYSLDGSHGGYPEIEIAIDSAIQNSGRKPDAVFSGHVHNYQRFERTLGQKKIPYVITGAGGYANRETLLHKMNRGGTYKLPFQTTLPDVRLLSYNDTDPGFMRVTVDASSIKTEYFTVPFSQVTNPLATLFDSAAYAWK